MLSRLKRDRLHRRRLHAALGREIPTVKVYRMIDSTNTEAKRLASHDVPLPALIAADGQSAGRGRMGRSFYSPAGTGLYFSLLCQTPLTAAHVLTVTSATAVALMRAIRRLYGLQTEIKWVNDLYLDGKKVAGILTEAMTEGDRVHFVIGIGVNLTTEDFPEELAEIAGSLNCQKGSREALIAALWKELFPYLHDPEDASWVEDYRTHSCVLGKNVTWSTDGQRYEGIALDVNEHGHLLVRSSDGREHCLQTGEISVRLR